MRIGTGLTVIGTLLVACGFPQPGAVPADGPPADAAPDAVVVPANTVLGRSTNTCVQASGNVVTPVDLSVNTVIKALIPDAGSATGYRVVVGKGSADGTFVIHDVPDGARYLLEFNNSYFDTTSHQVDNGGIVPERCAPAPVLTNARTPITFALTGLSDTRPTDGINATSLTLAEFDDMFPPPSPGSALAVTSDWSTDVAPEFGAVPTLVDQSLGDDLTLLHHRVSRQLGADGRLEQFDQIIDIGLASGVEMMDGSALTIPVAMAPAGPVHSLSISVNRQAYDGGFDATSAEQSMEVDVVAHPIATDTGFGENLVQITLDDWSGKAQLVHAVRDYPYADPFPAPWNRYMLVSYSQSRQFALPGAAPASNFAFSFRTTDLPVGANARTDNIVQLPSNILLGGLPFSAGGVVHFNGMAPVELQWGAVATAREYQVRVFRVSNNNGATVVRSIANLVTDQTSILIPAQVFVGATSFAFQLSANVSPTDYTAGHLVPNGLPSGTMTAPSGLFLFSATCGNGVADGNPVEACDGSGETAQCDVDCTSVVCGDGLLNVTAGEQCDTVQDTPGCVGATCKTSTCGDGYVNLSAEDCDFGGSNAANGCGSNCRWLGRCGDHIVQVPEACDSGGSDSATCDFDCTPAVCGDGYVNAAAGEQCDEGTENGHDLVCGSACKRL